jgi:hypothetical protein
MSNMGDRAEVINRGHDRRLPHEYCLDATRLSDAGYDRMTELTPRNLPSFSSVGGEHGERLSRLLPDFPAVQSTVVTVVQVERGVS